MQAPDDHKEYLRQQNFAFGCENSIFTAEESDILRRYGCWMQALTTGAIEPVTQAEQRFLLVDRGQAEPESKYELAWVKLKNRREYEEEYRNGVHFEFFDPAERWFPRHENWRYK